MRTKRRFIGSLVWTAFIALVGMLLLFLGTSRAAHTGGNVTLMDGGGNPILSGSNTPYSPNKTCGLSACHASSYNTITAGFHFQQGRDEVSDTFSPVKPWVLSPGMYGKW